MAVVAVAAMAVAVVAVAVVALVVLAAAVAVARAVAVAMVALLAESKFGHLMFLSLWVSSGTLPSLSFSRFPFLEFLGSQFEMFIWALLDALEGCAGALMWRTI